MDSLDSETEARFCSYILQLIVREAEVIFTYLLDGQINFALKLSVGCLISQF